jgi:hypothetical protein
MVMHLGLWKRNLLLYSEKHGKKLKIVEKELTAIQDYNYSIPSLSLFIIS